MPASLLPQAEIGGQTFVTGKFLQSREIHQVSRFLENFSVNILPVLFSFMFSFVQLYSQ